MKKKERKGVFLNFWRWQLCYSEPVDIMKRTARSQKRGGPGNEYGRSEFGLTPPSPVRKGRGSPTVKPLLAKPWHLA